MEPISRRRFLGQTGIALAAGTAVPSHPLAASLTSAVSVEPAPRTRIRIRVNGQLQEREVEDRLTLAEFLRDELDLTGTKIGCDRSECGACTVLLDGDPIYSCSYLAVWAEGAEVTTVEGLAQGERLDPLQRAFIEGDGPQCGFCTSGQLMSAKALLQRNPVPSRQDVREALVGNLCRCSNYNRYVEAVLAAARLGRADE